MGTRFLSFVLLVSVVSAVHAIVPDETPITGDCAASYEDEDTEWTIRVKRFKTDLFKQSRDCNEVSAFEESISQQLFDVVMRDSNDLGIPHTAVLDTLLTQTVLDCRWREEGLTGHGLYTAMAALLVSKGANPGITASDSHGNNLLQVTLNAIIRQLDRRHELITEQSNVFEEKKKEVWDQRNLLGVLLHKSFGNYHFATDNLERMFGGFSRKGKYGNFRQCQLLEVLLSVDVPINHKNRASLTLRDILSRIKKSKYPVVQQIQQEMIDYFIEPITVKENDVIEKHKILSTHMAPELATTVCEYLNLVTPRPEVEQIEEADVETESKESAAAIDSTRDGEAEDGNARRNACCKRVTKKLACAIL